MQNRTYLSENALLPTHADPHFGHDEGRTIMTLNRDYNLALGKFSKGPVTHQELSR